MPLPALPPLYPITDARLPLPLSAQVARLGEAGFPLVQFRGKPLEAGEQWAELRACLQASAEGGGWPWICVNDRADLAVLAALEGLAPWGLHLGQGDLPPGEARRLPGLASLHLGTSTHEDAEWSATDPACDHAGIGPFRATATKGDHAPPVGLAGLRAGAAALRARGLAPIAIGGLGLEDALDCYGAGAESLAMVGEIARAEDPGELLWQAQLLRWRARPPLRPGRPLVLIGGSGSGKSALARALGPRLALPVADLDALVAAEAGRCVAEIFEDSGEPAFREMETRLALEALTSACVLALGGGAWESEPLRQAVRERDADVLWIAERPQVAWTRVGGDPARPLARRRRDFMDRWRARTPAWALAPMVLPLGRSPEALAQALV